MSITKCQLDRKTMLHILFSLPRKTCTLQLLCLGIVAIDPWNIVVTMFILETSFLSCKLVPN